MYLPRPQAPPSFQRTTLKSWGRCYVYAGYFSGGKIFVVEHEIFTHETVTVDATSQLLAAAHLY